MRQATRSDWRDHLAVAAALVLVLAAPAGAQNEAPEDNSRGVRIIDAPSAVTSPPSAPAPAPTPEAPSALSAPTTPTHRPPPAAALPEARPAPPTATLTPPALTPAPSPAEPGLAAPAVSTHAPTPQAPSALSAPITPTHHPPPAAALPESRPAPPAATLTPPALTPAPSPAVPGVAEPAVPAPAPDAFAAVPVRPTEAQKPLTGAELDLLSKGVKVANSAELAVDILPGVDLALGARVSLHITTKKTGYLILVDIDPTGKLTQIYPNPMSLRAKGGPESSNLIRAGKPLRLPNLQDSYAAFEFVASPPSGTAMIVALLSDRPVQMIDLPDVPATLLGSVSAADHLSRFTSELRIPDPRGGAALLEANWSFAAKFYAIR